MSQHYSNPDREDEPNALPDVEVFYAEEGELGGDEDLGEGQSPAGYYFQYCFPGCLPDGDASGPYATYGEALEQALEAARDD